MLLLGSTCTFIKSTHNLNFQLSLLFYLSKFSVILNLDSASIHIDIGLRKKKIHERCTKLAKILQIKSCKGMHPMLWASKVFQTAKFSS